MTSPVPMIVEVTEPDADAGFGALHTRQGNLPLRELDVRARVDGLLARTVVRQTFANGFAEPLEATYIFPLPDRTAVNRFILRVGSRTVEGELQERAKARAVYEQAIRDGRLAAIAEEERPNVFTMRVGNLPPGESVSVELTLTGPLPVDHGEATFRFPLVVAPRYIPGRPLDGESVGDGTHVDTNLVPDASRITPPVLLPGQPNPVRLNLSVEVHPGHLRLGDFQSSLHTMSEGEAGGVMHFAPQPGERLDRDFVLRWRVADAELRTGLHLQPDADDPTVGTFALTLVPPREADLSQKSRDVVFVLDRSGSMDGWKMIAARRALGRMIDSLTDRDRFAVLAFDDRVEAFSEAPEKASDRQRFRAVEWLAKIESRGGTEMAAPLNQALVLLNDVERDRILVLVTDGQVGNEDHLLRSVAGSLKGIRVFTLGIDQAVNEGFLKRLAALGGGYCELVESEDRLDAVMDKVHRRIRSPLLTGLKIEPAGLAFEPGTLVPARLPDMFPGTPLTFLGRFRTTKSSPPGVSLQATDDAGRPWATTVSGAAGEVLAPVWARGHLRDLEDRYAVNFGEREVLEKQIVATSLKFNVLCRFTAFVAVDVSEVVNSGGERRRVTQPVEAPAGWDMLELMEPGLGGFAVGGASKAALGVAMSACLSADAAGDDEESEACSMAPSSPPPPPRMRSIRGRGAPRSLPAPTPAVLDFSAYRQRADELRQRLESAADPLRELGVLRLKLEELVDDLRSTGAALAELQPLLDLLTELQAFLANPDDVAAMTQRAVKVLSTFAGTKPKRRGWWK